MASFNNYKKTALFFIAPQFIITLVFFLGPAISALKQSFFFSDAFGIRERFAGLANFTDLFVDPNFVKALWITLILAIAISSIAFAFGLGLAYLVSERKKSQLIYKSLLLFPYAIAPAVTGILWRFLCQPTLGWLSEIFHFFGIEFHYLVHPVQALVVVIIAGSWQQLSYNFLFFFVAIQSIPKTLLDAAILDGATSWKKFWTIIVPLISPTSFFLLITNLIYALFDTFGIIDVMTNGGPGNSTTNLMYKIYHDGFVGMDLGIAASQSIILMVLVSILTIVQFRYVEKKVHYT